MRPLSAELALDFMALNEAMVAPASRDDTDHVAEHGRAQQRPLQPEISPKEARQFGCACRSPLRQHLRDRGKLGLMTTQTRAVGEDRRSEREAVG